METYMYIIILVIALFIYFFITNNTVHYYGKIAYYYGIVTLSGCIVIPFALLRPNNVKNIRLNLKN